MSLSLEPLLSYWRASLQDSVQHVEPENLNLYAFSLEGVSCGEISSDLCAQLWADAQASLSTKAFERTTSIPVLIAPVFLCAGHDHGQSYVDLRNAQAPVWLVGQCDKTGKLKPLSSKVQDAVIIDRDVIAPLSSMTPTYASLDDIKSFLDMKPPETSSGEDVWRELWLYVLQLFEKVFKTNPESWAQGLMVNQGCMISYGARPVDTTGSVRAIYERLLGDKEASSILLSALVREGTRTEAGRDATCREASRVRHVAQMGGSHALNKGQRQALSAVLAAPQGSIVAVNGPPGTGKTTLLQSIVASLWVSFALKGGEPPVILASSTNNQAITNILDSFKGASLPDDHRLASSPLSRRWIPKVEQYGLFLPSETRAEGAGKDYQIAACPRRNAAWIGLPEIVENKNYIVEAEALWLSSAQAWGAGLVDLPSGVAKLRARLLSLDQDLRASWRFWDDLHAFISDKTDASSVSACVERWEKRQKNLDKYAATLGALSHRALCFFHTPLGFFAWIPFVKRRLWAQVYAFLLQHKLDDKRWTWETVLSEREFRAWLVRRTDFLKKQREEVAQKIRAWEAWQAHIKVFLPKADAAVLAVSEENFQNALDVDIRTEMFHLAARYWEGRWILEMKDELNKSSGNKKNLEGWSNAVCSARWRRFAKLTPCVVATAYTAPRLFSYFDGDNRSLFNFADLLIVEEAGQVAPHVGGALFALAQRAVVVGDTQQIEPVWGVSPAIDGGNIAHYGLASLKPEMETKGMLASEGSVMRMAQAATAFCSAGHQGLFLDEHWRCRRSTISYCNDLAYHGKLTPRREDGDFALPPLGYAHVAGRAERRGSSWINEPEALVIATWIAKNKAMISNGKKLATRIAVVTPFKAQISVLQKALESQGLGREKIAVGTVHTLQGAERDLVLFSSVYSADSTRGLFFDRGVNMLNVAVSRAKESFLVFGDMRLFRPERSSPSGLLGRHLFKNPDCEILDIEPTLVLRSPEIASENVKRIDTLEAHRQLLFQAINEARFRLLIVSPYLSVHALEADNLPARLHEAVARGVDVVVCYDPSMNMMENGRIYPRAQAALEALAPTKAKILAVPSFHNKTLAVDDVWISEGSFNWLSASRQREGKFQRYEASILYHGGKSSHYIERAWKDVLGNG